MHTLVCLVCEDEALIALDLEGCLADAGLAVAGPFRTTKEALDWIAKGNAPDLALLNFKLADGSCMPLVHALQERGVPIVIQSGLQLDAEDMPPEVAGLPWLLKPVSTSDLLHAVSRAVPLPRLSAIGVDRTPVQQTIPWSIFADKLKGHPLAHDLIKRLTALCPLNEDEQTKLGNTIVRTFAVKPRRDILQKGGQSAHCHVLLSGMAAFYTLLPDGRRQITRFGFPGDLIDLDGFIGGVLDYKVTSLGACTVGEIPHQVLRDLSREHPTIGMALWRHTLADAAVFREWVVNVGRRTTRERIAHIICEVFARLRDPDLALEGSGKQSFHWPLTQQDIADAIGASPVHVNRSLQELRGSGLIELSRDEVTILDWTTLRDISGFEPDYLFPVRTGSESLSLLV